MQILKQLFNFYINSSVHVALAVFALTWMTFLEYHLPLDKVLLFFVFFATITGYNFVKYFGMAKFHHRRLAVSLKVIQIVSFFCFFFMCYFALQLQNKALLFLVALGLLTFFYAMPLLPALLHLGGTQNLRNIGGLKVYVIALVWAGVAVFLPIINTEYPINFDVIVTGIQRFIFVIVLMLPFEIRDLHYDSLKLATIPQKLGVKQTKIMGIFLLLLFFVSEFFKDEISHRKLVAIAAVVLVTSLFLIFSKKIQGRYYCSFWVESLPILWLLIWFLVR